PAVAAPRVPLAATTLALVWLDLVLMPQLEPLLTLGPHWLIGEAAGVALCLLPAQILARATGGRRWLACRASLQAIGYGAWLLFRCPVGVLEAVGADSLALLRQWNVLSWINLPIGLAMLIGLAAVHEFARIGRGTPIPFDPPQCVVTTGPYAYVANPMQ